MSNHLKSDGLAQKLYDAWRERCGSRIWPWGSLPDEERADWEAVAQVARDEVMRADLVGLEWLINASEGDAEAAPYLPGMRHLLEVRRRVMDMPMSEVERIAKGPMPS